MKRVLVLLMSVIFVSCGGGKHKSFPREQQEWQEIVSEKGKFKISFPNFEVKEETNTYFVDGKDSVRHGYSYYVNTQNENDENAAYLASYIIWIDYDDRDIQQNFDEVEGYFMRGANTTLVYERSVETNGYIGREWYFDMDSTPMKFKYRAYFYNGIMYSLLVLIKDDRLFNSSISRFFDSFEILDTMTYGEN
ncbi:MAG: hypothetical protein ACK5IQ_03475 [Bacteroidales bacterium]